MIDFAEIEQDTPSKEKVWILIQIVYYILRYFSDNVCNIIVFLHDTMELHFISFLK